jgi:hypothetical protein
MAAWSAGNTRRPVEDIFQNVGKSETAYEATFEDLARTQGADLARANASILFYDIDPARLQGPDWTLPDVVTPLLIGLLGATLVYGVTHLKLSPRRTLRLIKIPQTA